MRWVVISMLLPARTFELFSRISGDARSLVWFNRQAASSDDAGASCVCGINWCVIWAASRFPKRKGGNYQPSEAERRSELLPWWSVMWWNVNVQLWFIQNSEVNVIGSSSTGEEKKINRLIKGLISYSIERASRKSVRAAVEPKPIEERHLVEHHSASSIGAMELYKLFQ